MSVIETGSFGAKRRQKQQATPTYGKYLEAYSKRFKLSEHRANISPIVNESIPYVEIGECADTGVGMFSVERIVETHPTSGRKLKTSGGSFKWAPSNSSFETGEILVLDKDQYMTKYAVMRGLDFRNLKVSLKFKGESSPEEVVFWEQGMDEMSMRNRLLAKRKYKHWLKRASDPLRGKDLAPRIFTFEVMEKCGGAAQFLARVNEILAEQVSDVMREIMRDGSLKDLHVETVGQMLMAFLLRGGHFKSNATSFKTRLMFLFLECMVDGYGTRSDAILFGQLHSWLVLRTCDSCFEKVIMTGTCDKTVMRGRYRYSLESCALREDRYLSIAPGAGLDYEIKPHPDRPGEDLDRTVWKQWSHGYIRPRYLYGVIEFRMASTGNEDMVVNVTQHWGMSLITCLDGLYKGLKRATFGGGNEGLIKWANDYDLVVGSNLKVLKQVLIDLTLIYENHKLLRILIENVVGYIVLCTVPKELAAECYALAQNGNQEAIDFYDKMVRHCFGTRSNANGYILESLLALSPLDGRLLQLDNEEYMMTLVNYILPVK